jgi:serine/threonine protein kinase
VQQLNQEIEYKDTVSKEAIDLMKTMLNKVPKSRATAQDVLNHEWLADFEDDE